MDDDFQTIKKLNSSVQQLTKEKENRIKMLQNTINQVKEE